MPIYDFICKNCEEGSEFILKIANMDDPLSQPCPQCGKVELDRVINANYQLMSSEALGRKKAPREFRDLLSAIKRANRNSFVKD